MKNHDNIDADRVDEQPSLDPGGQLSFDFDPRQPLAPVLLTERQVCQLLGIGRSTLRSLTLRPKHINRCVRYLASDVQRYISELA